MRKENSGSCLSSSFCLFKLKSPIYYYFYYIRPKYLFIQQYLLSVHLPDTIPEVENPSVKEKNQDWPTQIRTLCINKFVGAPGQSIK